MTITPHSGRFRTLAIATLAILVLSLAATSALEGAFASSARRATPTPGATGGGSGPSGGGAPGTPDPPRGARILVPQITVPVLAVDVESETVNETAERVRYYVYRVQDTGENVVFVLLSKRDTPIPSNADPRVFVAKVQRNADVSNARGLATWMIRSGLENREAADAALARATELREELEARILEATDPAKLPCMKMAAPSACPAVDAILQTIADARRP